MITPDKGELVFVEGCQTAEQRHRGSSLNSSLRFFNSRGTCFNEQLLFGLPPLEGKLQPQGNCEVQIMPPGRGMWVKKIRSFLFMCAIGQPEGPFLRTAEIFDRVVSAPRLFLKPQLPQSPQSFS